MIVYLVALTFGAGIGRAASACNFGYIPLNTATRYVKRTDQPASWEDLAHQCRIQFPGYDLIGRHFLQLPDADKTPCAGALVPLAIVKINDALVFPESYGLTAEVVDNSTLLRMESTASSSDVAAASVVALNLTTNKWRLVDRDFVFRCALCQMAHRADLNASVIPKPPARVGHVFYGIAEQVGSNVSAAAPSDELYQILSVVLNVGRSDIIVNKTHYNSRNHTEFFLRIRTPWLYDENKYSSYDISLDYKFIEFYNADFCTYSYEEGMVWLYNKQGTAVLQNRPDNVVATRECTYRKRPDGDWDAEWASVFFWDYTRQTQCYLQEIKDVSKDIKQFAAKPDFSLDLGDLVQIVIKRVDHLNYANVSELAAARNKIFESIASFLENYIRSPSYQSQNANHYFANVILSNLRDADPQIGFTMTGVPNKLKGNFGVVRVSDLGRLETDISVVLSKSMYTCKAGLALVVVKDFQKDIFPTPVNKLMDKTGYYLSTGILMTMSFDNDDELSLTVDYYLEVSIRNLTDNNETAKYLRNFAAWSVDEGKQLTETCLIVDVAKVSYKCRQMVRDSASKSIRGRFVVNRGFSYDEVLNDTLEAARLINRYANIQVDSTILSAVRDIANYAVGLKFGTEVESFSSRSTMLDGLREILSLVDLGDDGAVMTKFDRRIAFLVDGLKKKTHLVGFSTNRSSVSTGELAIQPILNVENDLSKISEVDIVLSSALTSAYDRLGFSVFEDFDDLFPEDSLSGQISRKVSAIQIVLVSNNQSKYDISDERYYFEIFFNASAVDSMGQTGIARRRRSVLWKPDAAPNDKWSTTACHKLKSTRGSKQVFRCNEFNYGNNRMKQIVADGIYFTYEVNEFNDFLGENVALLVWLVIECIISLTSLLSIFITAIVIRKWRDEIGHKILLHMTSALAINIFFGFVNNFLILDTESVACIAVGTIRHYSYMAMFFWMFVLSGLQLKRLLSVLGARSTSNLQLKVAAFAWGMPLIIILVLFLSIEDAYRSVIKDRGFCYPEGLGFQIFVQGPAGLILALNVVIFVVILARIYACFGWGEVANLQRHANVKTIQLRRLRTAFFIFFLFGLSWTFHFLAEEGVIRNKFIFEYMFLMTACLHVFMLALFFVYLDDETREEWNAIWENSVVLEMIWELKDRYSL